MNDVAVLKQYAVILVRAGLGTDLKRTTPVAPDDKIPHRDIVKILAVPALYALKHHAVVVIAQEAVLDKHIVAIHKVDPVGVVLPLTDLLYPVDMQIGAGIERDSPRRGIDADDPLNDAVPAVVELDVPGHEVGALHEFHKALRTVIDVSPCLNVNGKQKRVVRPVFVSAVDNALSGDLHVLGIDRKEPADNDRVPVDDHRVPAVKPDNSGIVNTGTVVYDPVLCIFPRCVEENVKIVVMPVKLKRILPRMLKRENQPAAFPLRLYPLRKRAYNRLAKLPSGLHPEPDRLIRFKSDISRILALLLRTLMPRPAEIVWVSRDTYCLCGSVLPVNRCGEECAYRLSVRNF